MLDLLLIGGNPVSHEPKEWRHLWEKMSEGNRTGELEKQEILKRPLVLLVSLYSKEVIVPNARFTPPLCHRFFPSQGVILWSL